MRNALIGWILTAIAAPAMAQELDESSPRRLAVSRNGERIALASYDKLVRVWDAEGKLLHTLEVELPACAVAFSPDGTSLIAGTIGTRPNTSQPTRGKLYGWTLGSGEAKLRWKAPIVGSTTAIAVEPKGQWIAANTVYATLGIYNLTDGALIRNWQERGNSPSDLAISPDSRTIATAGQAWILWDAAREKLPDEMPAQAEKPLSAELSESFMKARKAGSIATVIDGEGKWAIAVGAFDNRQGRAIDIAQLDMVSAKINKLIAKGVDGAECVALTPDSRSLAVGLDSGMVKLFDVEGEKPTSEWEIEGRPRIRSVAYLKNGSQLAVATFGGQSVYLIDAQNGKLIKKLLSTN